MLDNQVLSLCLRCGISGEQVVIVASPPSYHDKVTVDVTKLVEECCECSYHTALRAFKRELTSEREKNKRKTA